MKKILVLIGVVAACGACCTLPLLLPMLGGSAAAGAGFAMGWELQALGALVFMVVVLALIWRRRQSAKSCASAVSPAESCGCVGSRPPKRGMTA